MKTYFVDAFTNEKFKGNPAAVCLVECELGEEMMQNIAAEIGFSETAFVKQLSTDVYNIRFFTPKKEIPLCGHATLASSKIIFETTDVTQIIFINCENVELKIGKKEGMIVMQFPVYDTEAVVLPKAMLEALTLQEMVTARYSPKNKIILIEIDDPQVLKSLQPDFFALQNSYSGINGVLVTSPSNNMEFDFQYRYFWPWAGTNEDPVTGGVQTFLTKYWAVKLGKNWLRAFQCSARTGVMTTELHADGVLIYGEAVIIFEGKFKS